MEHQRAEHVENERSSIASIGFELEIGVDLVFTWTPS